MGLFNNKRLFDNRPNYYAPGWFTGKMQFVKSGSLFHGQARFNTGAGFFFGLDGSGTGLFSAGDGGFNQIVWDGNRAFFCGELAGYKSSVNGSTVITAGKFMRDCNWPQNGLGVAVDLLGRTADGMGDMASIETQARFLASWVDVSHSSRKGRLRLAACDSNGDREGLRIEADGSQAKISFFAGAAAAKQSVSGSRAGNSALASLLAALAAYGIINDNSTA